LFVAATAEAVAASRLAFYPKGKFILFRIGNIVVATIVVVVAVVMVIVDFNEANQLKKSKLNENENMPRNII